MPNMAINAMTALWNSVGTVYSAIKMNVSDSGSAAGSKLLDLQVSSVPRFTVQKNGDVMSTGLIAANGNISAGGGFLPATADGGGAGSQALPLSDLFLASGGVINWGVAGVADVTITHSSNMLAFAGAASGYGFDAPILLPVAGVINFGAGDVTVTHAADALAFAGAANGYSFSHVIKPAADDGAALGSASFRWSDLFMALGAVLNIAGDWVATHTAGILTIGTGDLRVTNNFTNAASVATVGGAQTLLNKGLTSPVIATPAITGGTISGGTQTSPTINTPAINGGTIASAAISNPAFSGTPTGIAASTSAPGLIEIALDAEAQAKASGSLALVPANLAALGASTSFAGLVALASNAEAIAGTDAAKAVTSAALDAALDARVNTEYICGLFSYEMDVYDVERIMVYMPWPGSITSIKHMLGSGGCNFNLKLNGTSITFTGPITSVPTNTGLQTHTAISGNTFAAGATLDFDFISQTSADKDFAFMITVQRTA